MRGYVTDTLTGNSASVSHETPLPSDVTFKEKAANKRRALLLAALGDRTPYLETDFKAGVPQTVRKLTADQAGDLVVDGSAYFCGECYKYGNRVTLHITVGRFLDDVERVIGSGENVAGKPRELGESHEG